MMLTKFLYLKEVDTKSLKDESNLRQMQFNKVLEDLAAGSFDPEFPEILLDTNLARSIQKYQYDDKMCLFKKCSRMETITLGRILLIKAIEFLSINKEFN